MAPERDVAFQEENSSTPVMSVPASPVAGIPDQNAQSAISILLAVAQSQSRNDDDLTSLNWLHEHDLLKGMNINPSPSNSVNSNCVENYNTDKTLAGRSPKGCYEVSDPMSCYLNSISTSSNQTIAAPRNKHPHSIPYDPSVHTDNKPPYSFSCLIFMAIEDSHEKALPVKEIYAWIINHFPYFKKAPLGWKNSVRHNLSLNKCFQKVEKATNLGKGSLWTIDPKYKPTLIQALNRSTFNNSPSLLEFSVNKSSASHSPDPDLFPFLSRELAVNRINKLDGKGNSESLEAVDAAAVMLSLKNGTHHKHFRERPEVVMTSPSQDHTYSSSDNVIFIKEEHEDAEHIDFRAPKNCTCRILTFEDDEDQKIKEGAETLLNLAGVTLKRTHLDLNKTCDESSKKLKKYPQFDINKNETPEVISATSRLTRAKKKGNIKTFVSSEGEVVNFRQELIYKKHR